MIFLILLLYIILIVVSNVSDELTTEDVSAFMAEGFLPTQKPIEYKDQINLIKDLQSRVIDKFPIGEGIEIFNEREPSNLNFTRRGLCFDRSRYLDKLYKFYGFNSRHVFLLYKENNNFISTFVTKGSPSHAATQVLTVKGYVLVDSNFKEVLLNGNGEPIILTDLAKGGANIIGYNKSFWPIIGLYSRNGNLYKPYLPVPDVNLYALMENISYLIKND